MYAGERGPLVRIAFCVHHPCLAAALIAPPHETRACAPSRQITPAFPLACCSHSVVLALLCRVVPNVASSFLPALAGAQAPRCCWGAMSSV